MQGWGLGFYWRQMWSPTTPSSNPDSARKQDTNWPCILFPVMGVFGPLIFPYIAQERTTKNCTLFWTERSLWAISELFFLTVHSSLYTLFLSLRKSRITHRFWAIAQFIRAMCPEDRERETTCWREGGGGGASLIQIDVHCPRYTVHSEHILVLLYCTVYSTGTHKCIPAHSPPPFFLSFEFVLLTFKGWES